MSRNRDARSRLSGRAIGWVLGAALIVAGALLVIVFLLANPQEGSRLRVEAGKALMQVIVVVVLGAALKQVADAYQEGRQRADRVREFRADIRRRLVDATNVLRKAQSRIEADGSVETLSQQMLEMIDAGQALRVIRHEIEATETAPEPQPFAKDDRACIDHLLRRMYGYVNCLDDDFRKHKPGSDDRWEALSAQLPSSVAKFVQAREAPETDPATTFEEYLDAYEEVVKRITRASMGGNPEPSPPCPGS
jgi:hypothetical protein